MAELLDKAGKIQAHRGPDASGTIVSSVMGWNVGLAHQRLSIIDLSQAGNQPMKRADGASLIVYNGEIYNYRELRRELEASGECFEGTSDSEVVLAALSCWGIETALSRFNGMWAFAWLDFKNNKLSLARDRAGVKPLHYCIRNNSLYFASEIKAILTMAPGSFSLNLQAVGEYLNQSLLDSTDETFFQDIVKLPAAHYAIIDLSDKILSVPPVSYWSPPQQYRGMVPEIQAVEEVRELFFDSVRLRLRSDVPVGVMLSGGVDSSSIAAAMQSILGKDSNLNILAAVSDDPRFDESPYIDRMSRYLNCPAYKHKLDFRPESAFVLLEEVCGYHDEPVGSFSNVAHFLLMKKAKELGITVILSGQGADELLCGYKKYLGFYLQSLLGSGAHAKAISVLWSFLVQGTILRQVTFHEAKRYLPFVLRRAEPDVLGPALHTCRPVSVDMKRGMTLMARQILDLQRFSIPVLTRYEDRSSMAWSREIRVPFLDYRLIELLLQLPDDLKLRYGWTKYVFRKAMEPFLPQEIVWRKDKQAFVNPQSEWLKFHLRQGVLGYFSADSLIFKFGLLKREALLRRYERYCRQGAKHGIISFKDVFGPLMMEIWLRRYERYLTI